MDKFVHNILLDTRSKFEVIHKIKNNGYNIGIYVKYSYKNITLYLFNELSLVNHDKYNLKNFRNLFKNTNKINKIIIQLSDNVEINIYIR